MIKTLILLSSTSCCFGFNEADCTNLFAGLSGYSIDPVESSSLIEKGAAPTYGEATYEAVARIAQMVEPELAKGVFYDLGSGVGKVVAQIYTTTKARKCVGIELSPTRHKSAQEALVRMGKKGLIQKGRTISFKQGNILDENLKDATVVFMCSTCFSPELMNKITDKLAAGRKGLVVVTLKQLPHDKRFRLDKTEKMKMTWSASSPVYLYRRI
jgi:SAM-dependent methyltransferase